MVLSHLPVDRDPTRFPEPFWELTVLARRGWFLCLRAVPEIGVTDHAVERFRERVRPALTFEQADAELLRLLGSASLSEKCPSWCMRDVPLEGVDDTVGWIWLCPGVALPVVRQDGGCLAAVTCVANFHLSERTRRLRNERKASRRVRRRLHRQKWRDPRAGKQVPV